MNELITMTFKKDGWATGKIGVYEFQAWVFDEPSIYGINSGRVSKLFITKHKEQIVRYDRRWELEATDKKSIACYLQLLSSLEQLPA